MRERVGILCLITKDNARCRTSSGGDLPVLGDGGINETNTNGFSKNV